MKRYHVRNEISLEARDNLKNYSPLVSHLLFHRGIEGGKQAEVFLNPDYVSGVHDPFLMKNMEKTVNRIFEAIEKNEKIAIYSDYDCDGIPAGVILHDFFKKIGYHNFENYIPHRHTEGFGLNSEAMKSLSKGGATLLITADCGIADVKEIEEAEKLGMNVIVTDHHEPGAVLPPAFTILDSKQKDCLYPDKNLCGSGVAFKLIQALCLRFSDPSFLNPTPYKLNASPTGWEKWLLDLVGLATLSDMVPLVGENRVYAHYGLTVLKKTPRIGLRKLFSVTKINQSFITEDDIGFTISPRINAASRMGHPMDAFRLLSTTDETEAGTLAQYLVKLNEERKGTVASMVKEMRHAVRERHRERVPSVIVMGNPKWKPALLGLAANTFVEEHNCPVFLWGREGDKVLKGSCRSDGSVNLLELMGETRGIFEQFGGHRMSGGFTLTIDSIEKLESEIERAYGELVAQRKEEIYFADKRLSVHEVGWDLYRHVEKLAPFGVGNPKPLFLFEQALLKKVKAFGKEGNHTELTLTDEDGFTAVPAIGFFMKPDDFGEKLKAGERIDMVASLEKSVFRGFPELRLRIVDIL